MKRIIFILFSLAALVLKAQDCIQFEPLKLTNQFVLVVDRSGSMSGGAMEQAKSAMHKFIDDMRRGDEAAIVAFDDQIEIMHKGTFDKGKLKQLVSTLYPRGGTHLYDALGKASILAHRSQGQRIIIFLTDGHDGGSHLRVDNLSNLNASQGFYVYGIGLGDVNQSALEQIARKTGGDFTYTSESKELTNIYTTVLANYYQNFGNQLSQNARLIIRSLPGNRPVRLNGQSLDYRTPVSINRIKPGDYEIVVEFDRGNWKCQAALAGGQQGTVNARESELGRNVVFLSDVKSALVFLDGNFLGYTSMYPVVKETRKTGLFGKETVTDYSRQLIVKNVPRGTHQVRIVGLPEVKGFFAPLEGNFQIGSENIVVAAEFTKSNLSVSETDQKLIPNKTQQPFMPADPFQELE